MKKTTNKQNIPKSVRQIIYSYLPLDILIKVISKLSTADRHTLISSDLID